MSKSENHVDPFDKMRFMNRIAILEAQAETFKTREKAHKKHVQMLTDRFRLLSEGLFKVSQVKPEAGKIFCDSILKYLPLDVEDGVKEVFQSDQVRQAIVSALREYGATVIAKDLKL